MTAYDSVDYPSKPFLQCHPERLAVMGRLFGLSPAAPAGAKVLEVGCGDGLNLIAAAIVLPGASFVGIDLSKTAVARGRKMVRALGLRNVRLLREDLRVLATWTRSFDYVVAHGLYSWVPPETRDALLGVISHVLRKTGIAFVSYNAYPGAYLRQIVRDMVRGSGIAEARGRLAEIPIAVAGSALYRGIVADECADMLRREDGALFHDDLAETNQPVYFCDFMKHAGAHGLRYVAEADLGSTAPFDDGDRMETEQAADFRVGRRFRQTLLCHSSQDVLAAAEPQAVEKCYAGGLIGTGDAPDLYVSAMGGRWIAKGDEERTFLRAVGAAWPEYVPVGGFDPLPLFAANMVDLRTVPPPASGKISVRPEASRLARLQCALGMPPTNLHHFEVAIQSDSLRQVLELADGTRSRATLIRDLRKLYPGEAKANVALAVDTHLDDLRRYALLVG